VAAPSDGDDGADAGGCGAVYAPGDAGDGGVLAGLSDELGAGLDVGDGWGHCGSSGGGAVGGGSGAGCAGVCAGGGGGGVLSAETEGDAVWAIGAESRLTALPRGGCSSNPEQPFIHRAEPPASDPLRGRRAVWGIAFTMKSIGRSSAP